MKLPNAPLAEVVFELRWGLSGGEPIPIVGSDPGFPLLAHAFDEEANGAGFSVRRDMAADGSPYLGHQIKYRYYRSDNQSFPLFQIGPGIFACNMATEYEWSEFKELISKGIDFIFKSYPKTKAFDLNPTILELRYVDAFNKDLVGHSDIEAFLRKETNVSFDVPEFLNSDLFLEGTSGKLTLVKKISSDPESTFQFEIGTGQSNGEQTIVMISKVVKNPINGALGKTTKTRKDRILSWLDLAHSITSPFFRGMISAALMQKFK